MGTNYYFHSDKQCGECGREVEGVHIGKSSGGWCFTLHVMPEENINTWKDWLDMFANYKESYIKDESGQRIALPEFISIVAERKWKSKRKWKIEELRRNSAEPGPNGLVGHIVDGTHCIGHGDGTYDYIIGEFS